ncbi:MAG: hypothetical protein HY782_19970 [Chloroflexi bacterium]|nr:hypothetical protein [Chloroflexota bacterium]
MINISIEGQFFSLPDDVGASDDLVRAALAPFVPWITNAPIERKYRGHSAGRTRYRVGAVGAHGTGRVFGGAGDPCAARFLIAVYPLAPSPPRLPASSALSHLKHVRFFSPQEALERLATLAETAQLLVLYRKYFPREYAASTASVQLPVSRDGESGYSEREQEFLRLVAQHLFPLADFFFDDGRFPNIPLTPLGLDYEEDVEQLRPALHGAMALWMDDQSPFWDEWLPAKLRPKPGQLDWERFEKLCAARRGLESRLPLLIQFVSHNTRNLFFDMTWEYSVQDFAWTEEDMNLLIQEWREAKEFMQKLDPLLDRMEKHPRYWFTRLVQLWNQCNKIEKSLMP